MPFVIKRLRNQAHYLSVLFLANNHFINVTQVCWTMKSWNQNEDDYESVKHSLSKSITRLRYLYYSLLVFLIILSTLFGVLLVRTPKQLGDISIVLILGMILIGLLSATYILFKSLVIIVPVKTGKTKRWIEIFFFKFSFQIVVNSVSRNTGLSCAIKKKY